jgi:hypothetical protein
VQRPELRKQTGFRAGKIIPSEQIERGELHDQAHALDTSRERLRNGAFQGEYGP